MSRTYHCPERGCNYKRPLTKEESSEIFHRNCETLEEGKEYTLENCKCPKHKVEMVTQRDLPQVIVEYYDPFGKDFKKTYNMGKQNRNGVKIYKNKEITKTKRI